MKTKFSALSLVVSIFIGMSSHSFCQTNDFQVWSGISVSKDLSKKIEIGFDAKARFFENATTLKQFYTELSGGYDFNKHIKLTANYRFIQKNELTSFETIHRISVDGEAKQKISLITFSLRTRYQKEFYSAWYSYENPLEPTQYLRNKLTIEAKLIKKLSIYFSPEIYSQLDNPRGNIFDKVRYGIGMDYKINKHHFINSFFMLQKQINVPRADTNYILGINYKIKLS